MRKVLPQFIIYLILANIIVVLSNLHLFINLSYTTTGYIYPLIHREATNDYFSYLAYTTEGKYGHWLKRDPYTTEKTTPGILHFYYLMIGKIGGLFDIDAIYIYHIARIISVELFIFGVILICILFAKKNFLLAGILSLIATIPLTFFYGIKIDVTRYPFDYPWYFGFDLLERLYMPPHHIFGQAMLLFSLIFFFQYIEKKRRNWPIFSGIVLLIGALAYPPIVLPMLIVPMASFLYLLVRSFQSRKTFHDYKGYLFPIMFICLVSLFVVGLIYFQQTFGYPWSESKNYELGYWNYLKSFNYELLISFFVPIILAFPVVFIEWRTLDFKKIFLFFWAFMPFLLLLFVHILSIPKIRLINATSFIPLAILAVYFFDYFKNRLLRYFIMALVLGFYIISLAEYTLIKFNSIHYFLKNNPVNSFRIPLNLHNAFLFMRDNFPKDTRVMSSQESGIIIPAYGPFISFIGHVLETYNFESKLSLTREFYSEGLKENTMGKILTDNGIDYVLYGPYEKNIGGGGFREYDFLEVVYENKDVRIYKLKTDGRN